jgi:hypothetical protein
MKNFFTLLQSCISSSYYFTFIYNATYSEGVRSAIIKFSSKGVVFKTWEGEISQGFGSQIFSFSFR